MKPCPWKKLNRFLFSTTIFGKVSHWKIVWHTEFFLERVVLLFFVRLHQERYFSSFFMFFAWLYWCFFDIWKGNFIGVLFRQLLYKNQNCRNYLWFFKFIMWKLVARGDFFFQKFWEIVGVSLIFSKANQTRRTRFGFFFRYWFWFCDSFLFLTLRFSRQIPEMKKKSNLTN